MNEFIPRVLTIVPKDSEGCLLWRNWWPTEQVSKYGYIADWKYVNKFGETIEPALLSGKYNVLVTPRFVFREAWMAKRFTYLIEKSGVTWVYELDDDMFSPELVDRQVQFALYMTPLNGMSSEELEIRQRAKMAYERNDRLDLIAMVDGITVSTQPLAELVSKYSTAPVYVVPNAMNIDWFNEHMQRMERTIPPLTIGYSGGWRLAEDIQALPQAWANIARKFPDVQFIFHGWTAGDIITAVPADRLHILPWADISDYPAVIKNIDIACCAVADNNWNRSKSCIKWYEMSMAGAAVVASHALYGQEIRDGHDGLLATTVEEWEAQLTRLVVDAKLRQNIVTNAQYAVRTEHNLADSWPMWVDAWSAILKHRAQRMSPVLGGVPA